MRGTPPAAAFDYPFEPSTLVAEHRPGDREHAKSLGHRREAAGFRVRGDARTGIAGLFFDVDFAR